MLRIDEENPSEDSCEIVLGKDSNSNGQNIFLMVPQYVVITIGEVTKESCGPFLLVNLGNE